MVYSVLPMGNPPPSFLDYERNYANHVATERGLAARTSRVGSLFQRLHRLQRQFIDIVRNPFGSGPGQRKSRPTIGQEPAVYNPINAHRHDALSNQSDLFCFRLVCTELAHDVLEILREGSKIFVNQCRWQVRWRHDLSHSLLGRSTPSM